MTFGFDVLHHHRFLSNTSSPIKSLKANKTEGGTSKESIAQTATQPTAATPPMPPTPQPSTAPVADQIAVNKSESIDPWQQHPENESMEKQGKKPDMKPFKDEVEEDAVVAEKEADKVALLHEVPEGKENKTEGVIDEESDDAISEEIPSDSEVLNVSPVRPRPKLVTPFRGRCPVCRKYILLKNIPQNSYLRYFATNH